MSENRTELLAPAGDWDCLHAALDAGADAVYFGLPRFSARARAANFQPGELDAVMDLLRARNARGYVAFNTLVFPDELDAAAELVAHIARAGCDAIIVQDQGVARLVRRMVPTLAIHASTQMSLAEPRGIGLVRRELGAARFILPRELSLGQIGAVAAGTSAELEVFVHGALCISYSGQCLASLSLGGRSGNRGECAQPCRLPYELLGTGGAGRGVGTGAAHSGLMPTARHPIPVSRPYPLSPRDLAAWELIPQLVAIGVRALKIEGRLKSPEYVRAATAFHRRALDAALAGRRFVPSADDLAALAQGFSRGFTKGYLSGTDHPGLVEGLSPKPRGVRVGVVTGRTERGVLVELSAEVRAGDGLVFIAAAAGIAEVGGRAFGVRPHSRQPGAGGVTGPGALVEIELARGVDLSTVAAGSIAWKTDDPALEKRQAREQSLGRKVRKAPVSVQASARLGGELRLVFRDERGNEATISWPGPLVRAEKHPLCEALLREQLGRLGDSPFELGSVEADVDPVMVPKSVLNDLRRRAVARLVELRTASTRHEVAEPRALAELRRSAEGPGTGPAVAGAGLAVLVRSLGQLDAVLRWKPPALAVRPAMVYCELDEPAQMHEAVGLARSAGMRAGLVTTRVVEPGEDELLQAVADAAPDAVLVRNLASIAFLLGLPKRPELIGDAGLNAANELSAAWLVGLGLSRVTPAPDLDLARAEAVASVAGPGRIEAVVHGHTPLFHTKHCLYAAMDSTGRACGDCRMSCAHGRLELRDRKGVVHRVTVDAAGRNTVFDGRERSRLEDIGTWRRLGVGRFRLELLGEDGPRLAALLDDAARACAAELAR